MKRYGITKEFSPISDSQLDLLVRAYRLRCSGAGIRYLIGFLQSQGIRV